MCDAGSSPTSTVATPTWSSSTTETATSSRTLAASAFPSMSVAAIAASLDLFDQLELQLEQAAQVLGDEQEIATPVRKRRCIRFSLGDALLQLGDLITERTDAAARRPDADEVGNEQPDQELALHGRESRRCLGPFAQRRGPFDGERVHRPLPRLAGLLPRAQVTEAREPLRLDVVLALPRPVEEAATSRHSQEIVRARPAATDEAEHFVGKERQLAGT